MGTLYAALNRFGMARFWAAPAAPLNVVVTGGTRGIGKAIAREFLRCGAPKLALPLLFAVTAPCARLQLGSAVGL